MPGRPHVVPSPSPSAVTAITITTALLSPPPPPPPPFIPIPRLHTTHLRYHLHSPLAAIASMHIASDLAHMRATAQELLTMAVLQPEDFRSSSCRFRFKFRENRELGPTFGSRFRKIWPELD